MTLKIVILNTNNQSDGSFSVSGIFWLEAPTNNIIPKPDFKSQVPFIDENHNTLLQYGKLIEEPFKSGLFPVNTSIEDVKVSLQTDYNSVQEKLNNSANQNLDLSNLVFDGYTWSSNNPFSPNNTVKISSQYTQRHYNWTDWKSLCETKNGNYQYNEDASNYKIWFYDDPEVYICNIWKISVPETVLKSGYSQQQNDIDKLDFETNFKSNANTGINKERAVDIIDRTISTEDIKIVGGRRTSGWYPDDNFYLEEPLDGVASRLQFDGDGALTTRGATLTDEGSWRRDFSEDSFNKELSGTLCFTAGQRLITGVETLFTKEVTRLSYIKLASDPDGYWRRVGHVYSDTELEVNEPYENTGTGVANISYFLINGKERISVSQSEGVFQSGTTNGLKTYIYTEADCMPLTMYFFIRFDQRVANQEFFVSLLDNIENPGSQVSVIFDGTDNTKVKLRSSSSEDIYHIDEQLSSLPSGLNTTMSLMYSVSLTGRGCYLSIEGKRIAHIHKHIPHPYDYLNFAAGWRNTGTVLSSSTAYIDVLFFSNHNRIEVSNTFEGEQLVVRNEDEVYSINGMLTTVSTTQNQVILSYLVPSGKLLFVTGYSISAGNSTTEGNPVKIGKGALTESPSPGSVNSTILRSIYLSSKTNISENFGTPMFLASAGETVKVTVSPTAGTTTTWRASLDFILK
jgi:hypothetical protein